MRILGVSLTIVFGVWLIPLYAQDDSIRSPNQVSVLKSSVMVHTLSQTAFKAAKAFDGLPSLTVWQYQFTSPRDNNVYRGSIVGGNPFNRGGRTTTIPVVLIPLRVQFTGSARNFDPTSPDIGCLGNGNTALSLVQASPLFQNAPFTINGVNVGNTTYPDAIQRAAFWPAINGFSPAYHLSLSFSVAAKQTISVLEGSTDGATYNFSGNCSTNTTNQDNPARLGLIDFSKLDPMLNVIISNLGITPNQFPLFVLYGVLISAGPANNLNNCCYLGYHNAVWTSGLLANPGQTYAVANYDQGYMYPGVADIAAMSHEIMEWINNPSTGNLAPPWGGVGASNGVGGCQSPLETGDPLSGVLAPAITMPNGVTYHPQEIPFPQWFLGTPFAGAGGKYSSNGTFSGYAKACPPGGTN